MIYLVITVAGLCAAWLILKKRQLTRYLPECRDQSYLDVFEAETLASERGKLAEEMCRLNPGIANDREYFTNICYSSGVKPELAARAWVERALSARFRHQPH